MKVRVNLYQLGTGLFGHAVGGAVDSRVGTAAAGTAAHSHSSSHCECTVGGGVPFLLLCTFVTVLRRGVLRCPRRIVCHVRLFVALGCARQRGLECVSGACLRVPFCVFVRVLMCVFWGKHYDPALCSLSLFFVRVSPVLVDVILCVCVCVHVSLCLSPSLCVCVSLRVSVCLCSSVSVCLSLCISASISLYLALHLPPSAPFNRCNPSPWSTTRLPPPATS